MVSKEYMKMSCCERTVILLIAILIIVVVYIMFPECIKYNVYGPLYFKDHNFSDTELMFLETFCRSNSFLQK